MFFDRHSNSLCETFRSFEINSISKIEDRMASKCFPCKITYSSTSTILSLNFDQTIVFFIIQGLGLFAGRDLEKHTMVIEYIGELIRNEVANHREKLYEQQNRGIYMFRLDDHFVVDATMSGCLARYINHSCEVESFDQSFLPTLTLFFSSPMPSLKLYK